MAHIPIALQLYSVRDDAAKDLPKTLAAVAEMGYEGVELAGYYGHSAAELRQMLADAGLQVVGAHVGVTALLDDEFEQTVQFHKELGNDKLIVPAFPKGYIETKASCEKSAETLNAIAEKLKPLDMVTGFHNHWHEFDKLPGGETPFEIIFSGTTSDVIMQLDIGHATHGGADPVELLSKYAGRAKTVHVKEWSPEDETAVVGTGSVRWKEVFEACETVGGTEVYVVEHERYSMPPLDSVAACIKNLREMGK